MSRKKKRENWLSKNRDAIIITLIGVLISLILAQVAPNILDFIKFLFVEVPKQGLQAFFDYYYVSAATAYNGEASFGLALMVFMLSPMLLIITSHFLKNRKQIIKKTAAMSDTDLDNKIKKSKSILNILCGVYFLNTLFLIVFSIFPESNYNRFNRAIITITPYTSQEHINKMKSDWTQMRSKADYDVINEQIKTIKKENNLK